MVDIFRFDDSDIDRYATCLSSTVAAVRAGSLKDATGALEPIAGEIWMGNLRVLGAQPGREVVAGTRLRNETLRAQVFVRDRFRCTACGGRAVPRCILVAIHDLFPEQLPYDIHYKRGHIHPVFWAMAPEADHVVAHSRGGLNVLENLTTLHAACNTRKSDGEVQRPSPLRRHDDGWDGLVSSYPALIAAGAGDARHRYHRDWSRRYVKAWEEHSVSTE
ncbi:HNH endonuclease [Homoserinimonas sp. A447]